MYKVLADDLLPQEMLDMLPDTVDLHIWSQEPDIGLDDIDGYLVYSHPKTDGALMDRMPALKVISNFGVGVDHIVLDDAKARGLPVGNTPNVLDGATADMTFGLILATARNMIVGDHFARSEAFTHYDPRLFMGTEVHSTTLGIVGMGNIGFQVARRGRGFDMDILYHNRRPSPERAAQVNARYCTLDELLQQSDFVALTTPLTAETRDLIGRREFGLMKKTAVLINTARGGVIDHDALYAALTEGQIAAAGLDVTEPEPLPRDHPLLGLDNLVIMPHLGSATRQTRNAMAQRTVDNLMAGLEGRDLLTRVA